MPPADKLNVSLIDTLRRNLTGEVVTPGEKAYDKQRKPWLEVVEQHPVAIVNAATVADIAFCVRWSKQEGFPLAVQNTGHGIARACDGGLLLRLSGMKAVAVDAAGGTATFEPGVVGAELLAATLPHGLAYPSGQASNVGVTGYTLGGGIGWLARKFGAACHTILAATVVLADGSIVTASEQAHSNLFWAIRGGGGNFGVIASLTVKLVPVSEVLGGMAYYRMSDAPQVLKFYRDWTQQLGNDTSTVLRVMKLPPQPRFLLHGLTETCAIGICHADTATADAVRRRLLDFKRPVIDEIKFRPYSEMAQFEPASNEDSSATMSHAECVNELDDSFLDNFLQIAKAAIPPLLQFELIHLQGQFSAANPMSAHRAPSASFMLHLVAVAGGTSLPELQIATENAIESFGPVYSGEVLYNFLRGDQQSRVPAAFGDKNYLRLQEVKRKYDPQNLFSLNLNIPPGD